MVCVLVLVAPHPARHQTPGTAPGTVLASYSAKASSYSVLSVRRASFPLGLPPQRTPWVDPRIPPKELFNRRELSAGGGVGSEGEKRRRVEEGTVVGNAGDFPQRRYGTFPLGQKGLSEIGCPRGNKFEMGSVALREWDRLGSSVSLGR